MRHKFIQKIYFSKIFIRDNLDMNKKSILDKGG